MKNNKLELMRYSNIRILSFMRREVLMFYDKHALARKVARFLGFGYNKPEEVVESRTIEYPWVYMNLDSREGHLLDVGSVGSLLPTVLSFFGFKVTTIDSRRYEWELPENVTEVVGDIRKTEFPDHSFEIVTAISTIEHVGLGRYRDSKDMYGDKQAVDEIHRILKENGTFLMTVPFGKRSVSTLHRVYDYRALLELLQSFVIEKSEYYGLVNDFWRRDEPHILEKFDSLNHIPAVALIKAKKQGLS